MDYKVVGSGRMCSTADMDAYHVNYMPNLDATVGSPEDASFSVLKIYDLPTQQYKLNAQMPNAIFDYKYQYYEHYGTGKRNSQMIITMLDKRTNTHHVFYKQNTVSESNLMIVDKMP